MINAERQRILLLVDDEENILRSLKRVFRRDGYTILTANGGEAGLALLKEHDVGVILSDQRMPHMNGTEFLKQAKQLRPDTVRIVLSGYTDLESITEAINEGSIYKFLTKPWEDDLLRKNIKQAFEAYELKLENDSLNALLKQSNQELEEANQKLREAAEENQRLVEIRTAALNMTRQIFERIPVGLLFIDEDKNIVFYNQPLLECLQTENPGLIGLSATTVLPENLNHEIEGLRESHIEPVVLHDKSYQCHLSRLTDASGSEGYFLVFMPST
jgi:response regulator RpfG family c-di-GMP phosphodiesterase